MRISYLASLLLMFILSECAVNREGMRSHANGQPGESYRVETIAMPPGLSAEVGALDFLPDGRLVAGFLRGEIMIYDPEKKTWQLFAEGLQEPLGIMAVSPSEILVMQRPELSRIKDIDGDGRADLYETVTDDFGISGNYHEFNYGPVKDKAGNLFIALNSASSGGGVLKQVRGILDTTTMGFKGQMYSSVPYRGWVMKFIPSGDFQPFASGFRSPNGLGFDGKGNLFVTENQGDWVGTSALYHVQEGNFYGHPSSLVWSDSWSAGNPLSMPVSELEKMRTKASVLFPHGIIANSPTQPVFDHTKGRFGPFEKQFFIGEMNSERIVRVMLQNVDGELQGACLPFMDGNGLRKGNNRLAFAPDGSLWVGQARYGWAGENGIQRIVFTGRKPMEISNMLLTAKGFDLQFTQAVAMDTVSGNRAHYKIRRYRYEYHSAYGSKQVDVQDIPVVRISTSADRKKVSLNLGKVEPGYVYELTVPVIRSGSGMPLEHSLICYTVNRTLTH